MSKTFRPFIARPLAGAMLLSLAATAGAGAQARVNKYGYPEKRAPRPTTAAITEQDLMTRLYIFADDSMQGRQYGRVGNKLGTDYIAAEVKRLGLLPAGDSGTYFQRMPMVQRRYRSMTLTVSDGSTLRFNTDVVPVPGARAPKRLMNAPIVFGGVIGDTSTMISPAQAEGKFVVFLPPTGGALGGGRGGRGGAGVFNQPVNLNQRYAAAAAIATVDLDEVPVGHRANINNPLGVEAPYPPPSPRAPIVVVRNGVIGTVQDDRLAGGRLPDGLSPAALRAYIDSSRADSISRVQRTQVNTALDAVYACAVSDSIAVARGGRSMMGPGGIAAADSAARVRASAGGRGGRGGGGAPTGCSALLNPQPLAPQAAAGGGRGAGGGGAGRGGAGAPVGGDPAANIRITRAAAEKLLGRPAAGMAIGPTGRTVVGEMEFETRDVSDWARNVVAVVPGSDPALRGQYVLVSAHNDHVGFSTQAVDHDSLKAYNDARMRIQLGKRVGDLVGTTLADLETIRVNMDSLRRIRPARMDSISNGADDDGSGSMAILEIAEYIAKMPVKPKRSTIFVWQTGEEAGLRGSAYFAQRPTVPIDSIVANINIDMIGRGRGEDIPGGGPTYLAVVGSGFMSAELAQVVAATNTKQKTPLALDAKFDLFTTWPGYNNIYGRSDHFNFARQCIPIAFFFTGLHGDYHQRTDEPQYIDYPHYTLISNYIRDVVVELGTQPRRPSLDKPCIRS